MYIHCICRDIELNKIERKRFRLTLFPRLENERYLVKYYNPLYTTEEILSKILEVLMHLKKKFNVPRPVPQLSGNMLSPVGYTVCIDIDY